MGSLLHWYESLPQLVKTITTVLGTLSAVIILWHRRIRPAAEALIRIDNAVPVLLTIAAEFQPDSGMSLRDKIDAIDDTLRIRGVELSNIKDQVTAVNDTVENIESSVDGNERLMIRLFVATAMGFEKLGYSMPIPRVGGVEDGNLPPSPPSPK